MPSISLRKNMLKDIADVYDISNRGFKLCGQIVRFPVEDVHNILGLEISGNDVMQYINETMKSEDETVRSELFQRSEKTLKGNLVLLQFWYWERVRVANQHGIKYEERITRPPVMVFWNEENAKRRQTAWEKDGLDGGTVQSLEHWKKATKLELKLDLEQKLLELEHKQDIKFLEHKKEFASFRNDSILEDRINNLEAKEIHELVRTLIDQPISQTGHAQQHVKVTPRTRFHEAKDRIYDQSPIARNDTMETTVEQHSDPAITHIKKREPIIDDDYNTGSIDREAAMFLLQSYEDAWVVDIDGIRIKAGQLRRNVSQQYIFGEVINAYVQLSDVENDTASFISTFDVQKLADTRWELTKNYKKRIADKCKGKHLVFVPMNINGNHWGLLVLNFIKHEVQILESLSLRDEELEMTLVESIQCCVEFSIMEGLVNFENPFDLREWEIVPYVDIPRQDNSFTCAAFVIQYILAWDGEKMAHEFTSEAMESFCYRICTRLLHSDRNSLRFESYEKPIMKEAYLLENPDEREGHRHDSDVEDLQIISSATETQSKGEAITASGTTMTRRPRGRPRKIRVDEVSTKVPGIEEGTPKVKGAATRKSGVMDQVMRYLQDIEEKATKRQKDFNNEYSKIRLGLTKSYIQKMKEQEQTDKDILLQRDQLQKAHEKELSDFAKRVEKEQVAQLKKALHDQRGLFAGMVEQESAIADNVLSKTRTEIDEIINKHEQTIDSFNKQARLQIQELQNDVSRLKGMIHNLIPLIKQQEVPLHKKVEDMEDMDYYDDGEEHGAMCRDVHTPGDSTDGI
ncbi:hypothetical protein EJB05_00591, partial [Eragrostis curvula]